MIRRIAWAALRIGYGAFFAAIGVWGMWIWLTGQLNPFLEGEGPGPDFQRAMEATGFLPPLMQGLFIIGGLAMIVPRTAPLGMVLLAPFVTVIAFYHVFLTGSIVWGLGWAIALVLLAWHHRRAFVPLMTKQDG